MLQWLMLSWRRLLINFTLKVEGGQDFLSKVKWYLVFPSVHRKFWVGGEHGEGVLRSGGGANQGHYSTNLAFWTPNRFANNEV